MRKTFIEASAPTIMQQKSAKSLLLMRKTFIEATATTSTPQSCTASLPLMRKTFIEAVISRIPWLLLNLPSLPLMRKTFIEACTARRTRPGRDDVSSAYAEDFH